MDWYFWFFFKSNSYVSWEIVVSVMNNGELSKIIFVACSASSFCFLSRGIMRTVWVSVQFITKRHTLTFYVLFSPNTVAITLFLKSNDQYNLKHLLNDAKMMCCKMTWFRRRYNSPNRWPNDQRCHLLCFLIIYTCIMDQLKMKLQHFFLSYVMQLFSEQEVQK